MKHWRLLLALTSALTISLSPDWVTAAGLVGIVKGTDDRPIANATIEFRNSDKAVVTDTTGRFRATSLPTGPATIRVSSIGFEPKRLHIDLKDSALDSVYIELSPKLWRVGDITVTANRTGGHAFDEPRSVTFVNRQELSARQMSSLADGLTYEPGVTVQKTTHGHGAPIVGGLLGNYVLLTYNGVRLNNSTIRFGPNQYANTNDYSALDRIEVITGPTSVLYGSDALGGSVNLINRQSFGRSSSFAIDPSFSSRYSSADNGSRYSGRLNIRNDRLAVRAGATIADYGNLGAGGSIGTQAPTGWEETALDFMVSSKISTKARVTALHTSVRQDNVPRFDKYYSGSNSTYMYDPQNRDLSMLTLDMGTLTDELDSLHLTVSYQNEEEGITEQKTGSDIVTKSMDEVHTYGAAGHLIATVHGRHQLMFGAEVYLDDIESERRLTDGDVSELVRPTFPDGSSYSSYGVFLQDRWQLTGKTDLILGIRYSAFHVTADLDEPFGRYEDDVGDLTGSVALVHSPSPNQNVYLNLARGFRAPNLDDLVVLRTTNTGVDAPSTGLTPEESYYAELGTKYDTRTASASLAVFANHMTDLIDRVPGTYLGLPYLDENNNGIRDDNELDVFQKQNVGEAQLFGIQGRLAWQLPYSWLLRIHGSWHQGQNTSRDEPLSRIPPATGYAGLTRGVTDQWRIECFARAAAPQRRLSARDQQDSRIGLDGTNGWFTLNLRSEFTWRDLTVGVLFENIFDEAYKTHGSGVYAPGRSLSVFVGWN